MDGVDMATGVLVVLAVAHSWLGEAGILGPLLAQDWSIDEPRWAVERILRFAWHLTSLAWLALAAILAGGAILPVIAILCGVSALLVFGMLRGHLAWPLFLLASVGALHADGHLSEALLWGAAIAAASVLSIAACVHVYWAAGGRWKLDVAVPTNDAGSRSFEPGPLLTLLVAGGLFVFAALVVTAAAGDAPSLVRWLVAAGTGIFVLRAVGDNRSVGFTKREHESAFAEADDQWFTPIVVFIALGSAASLMAV